MKIEQAIAKDLEACDLMMAFGDKAAKRKAAKHRRVCFAAIKAMNEAERIGPALSDDELLKALGV